MIFCAAQCLYTFAPVAGGAVNVLSDGCGTNETDSGNLRVSEQRIHNLPVAVHYIHDTGGKACLSQQLRQPQCCRRHLFRYFEYEAVAAGDGERKHPHWHHGGEIERSDADTHAKWLTHRVTIHVATDILGKTAFKKVRSAAGKFHHLQAPDNRTACIA